MQSFCSRPIPKSLTMDEDYHSDGDYDEQPNHPVAISGNFYMSALEISNEQYEQFNASHKVLLE